MNLFVMAEYSNSLKPIGLNQALCYERRPKYQKSESSSPICIGFNTTQCEYCCKVKQKCCIDDVH